MSEEVLYPKDPLENKRYRAQVLLRCSQGTKAQKDKAASYYYKLCKENILFFFNVFLWTYDPRKSGNECHLPFITYPFQDEYILWMEKCYKDGQDGITEKSRDMGVSWMALGWLMWHWLFDDSFQALIGSRKEDLVDNSAVDSLFGKFDYMLERMPGWMAGEEFYQTKKCRSYMRLENPRNKNVILGESANRDFSRQGRYSAILLDEFSFWDYGGAVWKATGDSTKTRFAVSTSNGMGNKYYEIVHGIDKGELNIPKKRLHWSLHPYKTNEWYQAERARRTPIEIAQELDISYESSVKGRVYDNFSTEKNVVANLEYNPNLPLYVSWDFGRGDPTAMIWYQKDFETNHVYIIDAYQKEGKEITFFVPFVTGQVDSGIYRYTQEELAIIQRHKAWGKARHYGDPTGGSKPQSEGRSSIDALAESGIYVNTSYKKFKIVERYKVTYLLIPRLFVSDKCEEFIDCIFNSRWNLPDEEYDPISKSLEPVHDWTCLHGDTPIRTLGGWYDIKELEGKEFWVWSYSHEEKRLVPAKAKKCWKSGTNAPLVEVELDSGEKIKCTPEHRFMLRDGTYCEAQNLKKDYSLMPFYEFDNRGYRRIHLNDGSQADEHRYVHHRINGYQPKGFHVDHIDENKANNSPENLQLLSQADHCRKTQSWARNPEARSEKRVRTITAKTEFKRCPICKKESLMSYKQIYCRQECKRYKDQKAANEKKLLEAFWKKCEWCDQKFFGFKRQVNCSRACADKNKAYTVMHYNRRARASKAQRAGAFANHKVRAVRVIQETADVYDIEVPGYENFVANGVVVHNSHFRTSLEFFAVNEPTKNRIKTNDEQAEETKRLNAKFRKGSLWAPRPRPRR